MILNETNFTTDLGDQFCNAVSKVFGDSMEFLDFLEDEKYSTNKYDCYLDYNGENYIIDRETGEYINWYKLDHIGRCINLSIFILRTSVTKWIEEFLVEFKNCEASNADNAVLSKEDRAMLDGMRDTAYVCGYRGGDVEFAVNKALRRMRRFDLLPPCEREESEEV